jgi:hypothetical protein
LFGIIRKYDKNPELLTTPTPPNSPETKPNQGGSEVPPINA